MKNTELLKTLAEIRLEILDSILELEEKLERLRNVMEDNDN
jgi:hypothetical protein